MIRAEKALRLASLLENLPPDQRRAICLKYMDGMSLMEIAERMGRSKEAIGGLLKRGMKSLREQMSLESWI